LSLGVDCSVFPTRMLRSVDCWYNRVQIIRGRWRQNRATPRLSLAVTAATITTKPLEARNLRRNADIRRMPDMHRELI
jgi:hypothetical protein